jgi:RNA polymerase sigma-70 factor, ECF subfamily
MQTMLYESPLKEDPRDTRQEFQKFYQENLGSIYRYVYSQVGNSEEAEDLTSQIFLKVVSSIDQERSWLSMKKWLYLITRSIIADYWRAHYRLPKSSLDAMLEAGWEGPAEVEVIATSSGAEERVERLLRALPEKYREVLKCRFLLKLSVKATALQMGVTEANVKVLQFRALKRAAEVEQVATEQDCGALSGYALQCEAT